MLSASDDHNEKQNIRSFRFVLITLIAGIVFACIIIPFTAFPIGGGEMTGIKNQTTLLSRYNNSYDFNSCEIIDVKTLPYSVLFLLQDTENNELLLLQAEKYMIYSRYRLIFNPQPLYTDRIDARDDLFYKIDVSLSGNKLTAEQRFSPSLTLISASLCYLILILSFFKVTRKLLADRALREGKTKMSALNE